MMMKYISAALAIIFESLLAAYAKTKQKYNLRNVNSTENIQVYNACVFIFSSFYGLYIINQEIDGDK